MDYKTFNKGCLEEAKRLYKTANADQRYVLEKLFPELRETEDEKIRKNLINFLDAVWHLGKNANFDEHSKADCAEWISWLEKQEGCELIRKEWLEHIKQSWYKEGFIYGKYGGGTSKEWTINDTTTLNELIDFLENGTAKLQHDITRYANWLKIQLAPKVKPKFNVGEWITNSIETVQITGYDIDYGYQVDYKGNLQHRDTDIIEKEYHLWTIADAMDGDVLTNGKMVVIFKHFEEPSYRQHIVAYIGLDRGGNIQITDDTWRLGIDKAKPATKEQRDIFFQKMKEAGYQWDSEKKELKKFHIIDEGKAEMDYCFTKMMNGEKVSSAWSEEDAFRTSALTDVVKSGGSIRPELRNEFVDWLKSLKDRVQPQPKQEWSAEDEQHIDSLLKRLEGLCRKEFATTRFAVNEDEDWLKSIKNRVQPKQEWSEEDNKWIESLIQTFEDGYFEGFNQLESYGVIDWLKSFKNKYENKSNI